MEMVGPEVMAKGVRAGTHSEMYRKRDQIVVVAILKPQATNEVQKNGIERRLIFDNI